MKSKCIRLAKKTGTVDVGLTMNIKSFDLVCGSVLDKNKLCIVEVSWRKDGKNPLRLAAYINRMNNSTVYISQYPDWLYKQALAKNIPFTYGRLIVSDEYR